MIKKVGYCIYAHKSNIAELLQNIDDDKDVQLINEIVANIPYDYTIVKYNKSNNNISFINCPEWDIVNEPTVEESYIYNKRETGLIKTIKGGKTVYHNKWQFVADDYDGFDIEKAKRRTKIWNGISDIKYIKSKIGNKIFWHQLLKENDIEI